jgi:hypothetical protein
VFDRDALLAGTCVEDSDAKLVALCARFRRLGLSDDDVAARREWFGCCVAVPDELTASESDRVDASLGIHDVCDTALGIDDDAWSQLDSTAWWRLRSRCCGNSHRRNDELTHSALPVRACKSRAQKPLRLASNYTTLRAKSTVSDRRRRRTLAWVLLSCAPVSERYYFSSEP